MEEGGTVRMGAKQIIKRKIGIRGGYHFTGKMSRRGRGKCGEITTLGREFKERPALKMGGTQKKRRGK